MSIYKDIAIVCALNSRATIEYKEGAYKRNGVPTEAALKVVAEKIGNYDSSFNAGDRTKNPNAYSDSLAK